MRLSHRIEKVPPYPFVEITRKINQKRAEGVDIITFAIGDPDIPTPQHIMQSLHAAADVPANHRYPESDGLPEFRQAVADWYEKRFGLHFDRDKEVLPLLGSKEGIANIAYALIDPGDVALVPDPGYPVYSIATMFAGGEPYLMPLREENNFLPDFSAIPEDVLKRAKVLWINYPNNPTAAVADISFYEEAVAFAKKWDLAVCHDAAYSEVAFDGYKPVSFLQVEGARDIGIEFHSLSKSYNMTGWRIGMAVGNADLIHGLFIIKSNVDSGVNQAVQQMAITALEGSQACIAENTATYKRRRDRLVEALRACGLRVQAPKASLYVWAHVPEGFTSAEFAARLIDDIGVVVTPGPNFGKSGEGYVRLSITAPDERVDEGAQRMLEWSKSQK
ncbi:MAG TPA: LL-diaminopimelate aminotransferase [Dehalococcoidia bacterium]|jgi:LL-diaminopimelate aminotransferase|nr:LL-diaminopimelate aminotransferase [Dehalococcoidia bacterium]